NLPNTDEGIDLIAETFDKEYWAIQCKYRSNPNETLTVKGDLSTFNNLAFTYCKNITHAIVCATVNKPPKKIKLLKSIGFETLETWLSLDDGDLFTQIKAKAVGKVYKPTILKPRTHQVAAIKKTIEHFKSNERGKIIMPCGTGKSLTAFWIAKQMGVKSILVAVPSLALLQQTLKVWTREFLINGIEPEWFCVCSDGTVKDEQDDYVTDTADLGIKVDTDPSLIKQFLKKKTSKIKVVFTTYQSGRATAKGSRGFTYDLGIMDEAHKTVGSKTKEMAHLLHQKNVKIKKRIFMTATERLFRGDSDEFMSMDDPRDYGSLIYELSFKEAINSKPPIISDYKIITFGITTPEIQEIYESNKYLEVKKVLKDITAREFATAIALRKAIKKLKIKNAISFHRSIRRADNFRIQQDLITKIFPSYGKLKSFHVRGDMPTSDRAIQMRNFAEGEGLMTNARCLTEGVDLPAIDCVVFTDPKRSKVDIVQAAGRALRLSKGKKFGYILIPIFIPDGADFNEAAEEQGFDDVAVTVRALATTDTRITEYLRVISEGKKPRGGSPVDGLTSVNSLYKVEAEEFDKAIKLKVWDKVATSNWRSYSDTKKYVQENNIKSSGEFKILYRSKKLPRDIPLVVDRIHKNLWEGWPKFLGVNRRSGFGINFLKYKDAKKYILTKKLKKADDHSLFLKNSKEKIVNRLPRGPEIYYKKEWENWGKFLGTGLSRQKNFLKFKDAKKLVQKNKIASAMHNFAFIRNNNKYKDLLPRKPSIFYKNEWKSWQDYLGKNYKGQIKKVVSFERARKWARSLNFKSVKEWQVKNKKIRPDNIPGNPASKYKSKWKGWNDFLNTNNIATQLRNYWSYKKASEYLQKLKFKNTTEFHNFKRT
ncbi:DEAD/DEAH box helicase family protein, partial [Candidatus Pelagibacter ubique]|nr:DEAD/DEAH box helicase family protein [Candidatus Pelagibacter ubique]